MLDRKPIVDPEYLQWVRTQPCVICGWSRGLNAVHHCGDDIRSKKANDHMVVPLCDRSYNKECPNCHHEKVHKKMSKWVFELRDIARQLYDDYVKEVLTYDLLGRIGYNPEGGRTI